MYFNERYETKNNHKHRNVRLLSRGRLPHLGVNTQGCHWFRGNAIACHYLIQSDGLLSCLPSETHFSEIRIKKQVCSYEKTDFIFMELITVGREATTPKWFVVWRRNVPRVQLDRRTHWTTNHNGVVAVTTDRPWSIPIITWLNNLVSNVFTKYTFTFSTKSSDVAYPTPLWRHASLLNDGSCSYTHPVVRARVHEECRQVRKTLWSANAGKVIRHSQNH